MKTSLAATSSGSCFSGKLLAKYFWVFLCLLGAWASTTQANAGTLYGSTAASSPGELYIINPATGAVVQDIGPLNDSGGTNYPMTGLAFHPASGVLYGATGNNPAATAARLVTINPNTGLVTVIGFFDAGPTNSSGVPSTMGDLAFDSAGNLYGVGTIGGPQLYSINILTGKATVIGGTGLASTTGGGLAISPEGVFYGTPTSSRYGTYDPTLGTFTLIVNPIKPLGGGYGGLDFDENGVLYGINVGGGTPPPAPPTSLVIFNPTTGAVTDIGQSVDGLDAIAFQFSPRLTIAKAAGNQVTLRWLRLSGFNLEYKTNLTSVTWLTNTTPPTVINGTNTLTLAANGFATFFRLHKP